MQDRLGLFNDKETIISNDTLEPYDQQLET